MYSSLKIFKNFWGRNPDLCEGQDYKLPFVINLSEDVGQLHRRCSGTIMEIEKGRSYSLWRVIHNRNSEVTDISSYQEYQSASDMWISVKEIRVPTPLFIIYSASESSYFMALYKSAFNT